jgi:hypothetical protein
MMSTSASFMPFAARPIRFLGVNEQFGYRLKTYSITYGESPLNGATFERGMAMATRELPVPAYDVGRPGLGFVICHQGRTGDYIILCWWDRENELPIRVFVRDDRSWRPAQGSESVCAWDLEVIWHERCAYVETMLKPNIESPVEAYCQRVCGQ